MQYKVLALSAAVAVVNADLRLNTNDIPNDCTAVCRPIRDLGNICTVNFIPGQTNNNSDQLQDELDAQCVCTNTSFDVKNLAAECASCMSQKVASDQQRSLEGINSIMNQCGFQSTSYASSATSAANTIIVLATRLTASSQLTTTIGGGATPAPTSERSSRTTDRAITTTFLTSNGGGFPSIATSTIGGGRETGSPNAAAGVVAPGSNSVLGAAGLAVAGAFALGAFML
ncbi:Protein CAP22 [Colletotrichum karsti]|uniref:Protein CAP22 n=1 Tax=Colletotrichum karsti TaxID=1095194 RepID=A0A9P6I1P9_9PEZI|nr:Protein CAP22 [Colletotrichum karsti]KAF9874434.1 Protein CAP22 [Colletotrichum karsti]